VQAAPAARSLVAYPEMLLPPAHPTHLPAVTGETELYLALDPLADKAEAAGVAGRLGMWLFARHDQLFSL